MADPRPTVARLRALVDRAQPPCATLFVPFDPKQESISGAGALHLRLAQETLARRLEELGLDQERRKRFAEALAGAADDSPPAPDLRARAFLVWEEEAVRFGLGTDEAVREGEARVAVGHGFALRPLLRAARRSRAFLVLTVSTNHVALYASDDDGRRLLELPREGIPESLEDALGRDLGQRQADLQFHSTRGRGEAPVYHGRGGAPDEGRTDLMRFHRVLGSTLRDRLREEERPIVLAAETRHHSALREEAGSLPILEEGIVGNVDHRPPHELAAEARERVVRWLDRREAESIAELERGRALGKAAIGLEETLRAVAMGRARLLFVPAVGAHPGRVDPTALRVVAPWGDEDLSDELATLALRQGGEVVPWEPGRPPADGVEFAAVLR